jgi:hypothetical protein
MILREQDINSSQNAAWECELDHLHPLMTAIWSDGMIALCPETQKICQWVILLLFANILLSVCILFFILYGHIAPVT